MLESFLNRYGSEILYRTGEHLILVAVAMGIAIIIAIPLGIMITRRRKLAQPILIIANAIQTIPSLAIFGFLLTVPFIGGIGKASAITALTLYALLPLIRNTYTGIKNVPLEMIEGGLSLGLSRTQVLWYIELPLALEVILAGIRVSTVICVGITTIAAAIGGGGLGVFIFRGIATVNNGLILAGAIPAAVIALVADGGIGWIEKSFTQRRKQQLSSNKRRKWIWIAIFAFLLFSLAGIIHQQRQTATQRTIVIGSKNFTEQVVLGEILAQTIENNTNLTVERQFNLGGTFICHEAVKSGQIAAYVEYTGTALTAILKQNPVNDPQKVYEKVKNTYENQFNLKVFPSLGFENTYAIVIRQADAQRYNLTTLSQISQYTPQWTAGFGPEFLNRKDGYQGLAQTYSLKFANPPQEMDLGLMYKALSDNQVDLVAGNSTDGLIPVLNLVILEDDKQYFPPYEAVPVFNKAILENYPQLNSAVMQLSDKISAQEMQRLNYAIDDQAKSVNVVVREFLREKQLI